jgi:hypothetical protein
MEVPLVRLKGIAWPGPATSEGADEYEADGFQP